MTVVEKWECEYVSERRISAADMWNGKLMFGNNCHLRFRDPLYGTRASPVWLQKKCVGKEKIHYVDFTSLYPSMQKDFKYPVGRECEGVDFNQVVGLVKCDILPPKHLYFPVLLLKINNKLLFELCYLCVMECKEQRDDSDNEC